jgi:hypothetical protein
MDPNDFIEMKDFKESLKQGSPIINKDGANQKVFDAAKAREEVDRVVKKYADHVEL